MAVDNNANADVTEIGNFDEIIDVRTPEEYAEDCIPDAINLPVLGNDERVFVGTLYKKDPFLAKKHGAGLLAANLANHLQGVLSSRKAMWKPLVYCWRGGQRSGAVVEVLRRIGWPAAQLVGGYKAYRNAVISGIVSCVAGKRFLVIAGKTGVGKTRLLNSFPATSILDLEKLANHRGSVFGGMGEQPAQRKFETLLYDALKKTAETVFIESESRKIGQLHIPSSLLLAMRKSPAVLLQATQQDRVTHIITEYEKYIKDQKKFKDTVGKISPYAGKKRVAWWCTLHENEKYNELIADLLENFYDIGYEKSLATNYAAALQPVLAINPNAPKSFAQVKIKLTQLISLQNQ